jgi:hypothetical protein
LLSSHILIQNTEAIENWQLESFLSTLVRNQSALCEILILSCGAGDDPSFVVHKAHTISRASFKKDDLKYQNIKIRKK